MLAFTRVILALSGLIAAQAVSAADINVVLLGGQSNMAGRAPTSGLPADLKLAQTDVGLFYSGGGSLPANTWIDLAPGSGQNFGPEVTLGRTLADAFPNLSFALIKHAVGGTNLFDDWDPATGSQYATFTSTVQAGLQAIINAGDTPHIIGMTWLQGENDAVNGRTQAEYAADLTQFVQAVRTDFAGGADLRFVIGMLSDQQFAGTSTSAFVQGIQAAQEQVAASMTNVGIFNTDDLALKDDRHFDAAGQQQIGIRFAQQLVDLPDPDPDPDPEPTATSARFDLGVSNDSGAYQQAGWTLFDLSTSGASGAQTSAPDPDTGWTITVSPPGGSGSVSGRNRNPLDATTGGTFTLEDVYIDFIVGLETLTIEHLDPSKTYDIQLIMFDDNTDDGRTQTVTNITDGASDVLGVSAGPGTGSSGVLDSDQAYSIFGYGLSPDASGALTFLYANSATGNRSMTNGVIITQVATFDPADLDQDGDVDDADFGIAFAAFTGPGNGPSSNPAADLDNDSDVDDADFGLSFAAFTGPGGQPVPEPAGLSFTALAGLVLARRRRHRCGAAS